jgi:hypothetical protein
MIDQIDAADAAVLARLARGRKLVVDVGCFAGGSALAMLPEIAKADGRLIAIDTGSNNIEVRYGTTVVVGDTTDIDSSLAATAALTGVASTTSLAIAAASKAFEIASGQSFVAGDWVLATSDADPTNYMHGPVTTFSGTTLTVNVDNIGGSGTFADWTIRKSGTQGATGAAGAGSGDLIAANNLSDVASAATALSNLGGATSGHNHSGVYEPADATILKDADLGGSVQPYDADTAKLDVAQEYTQAQNFNATTLSDGATISWDAAANQVAGVTLGGNRTMAAPTNLVDGATYILHVIQDGTGSRTLTWNAVFQWPGGTAPTLTTTASARDIVSFISDGTNIYGAAQLAFA